MSIVRLEEAKALVREVEDPHLAEFLRFGLTSLLHLGRVDGEIDAVALLDFLRYLHKERRTMQAVMEGDKAFYGWGD